MPRLLVRKPSSIDPIPSTSGGTTGLFGVRNRHTARGRAPEVTLARFAGRLAGGVYADVVFCVDGERFHVSALFPTAYRDDHIHHSGRPDKQGNSSGNGKGDGAGGFPLGQLVPGCVP